MIAVKRWIEPHQPFGCRYCHISEEAEQRWRKYVPRAFAMGVALGLMLGGVPSIAVMVAWLLTR